jgi:hypothetical protein
MVVDGKEVKQMIRDTNGDGKKDTWLYFKNGKPFKKEIDTNGDELPDKEIDLK